MALSLSLPASTLALCSTICSGSFCLEGAGCLFQAPWLGGERQKPSWGEGMPHWEWELRAVLLANPPLVQCSRLPVEEMTLGRAVRTGVFPPVCGPSQGASDSVLQPRSLPLQPRPHAPYSSLGQGSFWLSMCLFFQRDPGFWLGAMLQSLPGLLFFRS